MYYHFIGIKSEAKKLYYRFRYKWQSNNCVSSYGADFSCWGYDPVEVSFIIVVNLQFPLERKTFLISWETVSTSLLWACNSMKIEISETLGSKSKLLVAREDILSLSNRGVFRNRVNISTSLPPSSSYLISNQIVWYVLIWCRMRVFRHLCDSSIPKWRSRWWNRTNWTQFSSLQPHFSAGDLPAQ